MAYSSNMFKQHWFRNEVDYQRHVDCDQMNQLEKGHDKHVQNWPYATFYEYVTKSIYTVDWNVDVNIVVAGNN